MVLPQFGVIALEIRTLKKGHTEKWRAQKHSWCVEHQRIFACFINALVYFIPKQWYAKFIKNVYNQSYQQYVHYASVALCAFGTSVFSLSLSVCLLYVVGLLYYSIFRKKRFYSCFRRQILELDEGGMGCGWFEFCLHFFECSGLKNMLKIAVFSGLVTRMESITCRGAF